MGKATKPHHYSNEFQRLWNDSSCLHWVSPSKSIWNGQMGLGGEAAHTVTRGCKWWAPFNKSLLACFHPPFMYILGCTDFSTKQQFGSCLQRTCAWTMIVLAGLYQAGRGLVLFISHCYDKIMALKAWVFKSVDNILGNMWVCGRFRPYSKWSCGRKLHVCVP